MFGELSTNKSNQISNLYLFDWGFSSVGAYYLILSAPLIELANKLGQSACEAGQSSAERLRNFSRSFSSTQSSFTPPPASYATIINL